MDVVFLVNNFRIYHNVKSDFFSQLYSKESFSKRVFLLGLDNFFTGGGPKNFARWKIWLWRFALGLCIALLQSLRTACNITRCCWSSSITNRSRNWLLLHNLSRSKLLLAWSRGRTFILSLRKNLFFPPFSN